MTIFTTALGLLILLLFGPTGARGQTFAETKDADFKFTLSVLRDSVAQDFAGFGQFDDASELSLDDRLTERTVVQSCRSVPEVLIAIRDTFPRYSLHEFSVSRQFPRNAVYFRRTSQADDIRDVINFYFLIEKNAGIDCKFTFGAFARTVINKASSAATKKTQVFDKLVADTLAATKDIEKALANPRSGALYAPPATPKQTTPAGRDPLLLLREKRLTDTIFDTAVARATRIISEQLSEYAPSRKDVEVLVVRFEAPLAPEIIKYKTSNCIAVPHDFAKPTIVCSADYLSEIEAVLRFFENAGELNVRRTEAFRHLARDFGQGATPTLLRLRANPRIKSFPSQNDEHITDHMTLALLFLLSHEVGHFLSSSMMSSIDAEPPVDTAGYRASILRLCLQADQFKRFGFQFGGMDSLVVDPSSAGRAFIERYRAQDKLIGIADLKFREELLADMFGTDLALRYFRGVAKIDRDKYEMDLYLFLENLESLATYFWYKSFFLFTDATCGGVESSGELSACLGARPENFVAAADVFGRFHRNIFLRAYEVFGIFIGEQTTFFDIPEKDRIIAVTDDFPPFEALDERRKQRAFRLMASLQRYFMLREVVDTPLKFAYTGCTLGWAKEIRGGTVPLMILRFFSYEEEMERFKKKLMGK